MAGQPQGSIAYIPDAVLVKVGDGHWLPFEHEGMMKLNVSTLLKELKHDEAFAVELSSVALSKCVVKVCASASSEEPPNEDEMRVRARELKLLKTLGGLLIDMGTAGLPYLYIRVELPAVSELKPRFEPLRRNVKSM